MINITEIAEKVQVMTSSGHGPSQIALELNERGISISAAEVAFMQTYSKFLARLEASRSKRAARRALSYRRRARIKERADRTKAKREEHRQLVARYERWGCTVDRRGRVKLPRMEAAE